MTDTIPTSSPTPVALPLGMGAIVRRYFWIPLLLGVAAGVAGYVIGGGQTQTFRAKSRLTVADVDVSTRSVPGFVDAAQTLSATYSRIASDRTVVAKIARQVALPPGEVADRISSTPIPDSTLFTITAQGPDEASAVKLNAVATRVVVRTVSGLDSTSRQLDNAFKAYRTASRQAADINDRISQLKAQNKLKANTVPRPQILKLQEQAAGARLRADTAGSRYSNLTLGSPSAAARKVSVLSLPQSAKSDIETVRQRLGAIGLVVGIALGLAIATLLGQRRWRRLYALQQLG